MQFHALPERPFDLRVVERRHVGWRRRGWHTEQVVHDPLAALHDRRAVRIGRDRQNRALAEQARARVILQRHAAEVAARHVRDAVVPREPFVDERVVRRQQLADRPVLTHLAFEKQPRLLLERRPEVVVEGREPRRVRPDARHVAQIEPLLEEVADQRVGAPVREHAPHLPVEHGRLTQRAVRRDTQQLVVGDAAPQEERDARGEVEVADRVRRALRDAGRIGFEPEEELRLDQQPRQRRLNARVERRPGAALLEERDEVLHFGGRGRAAIGAPGQRRENPRGARGFVSRSRRPADEDALAAGAVGRHGAPVRPPDRHLPDRHVDAARPRVRRHALIEGVAGKGQPVDPHAFHVPVVAVQRHGNGVRAGRRLEAEFGLLVGRELLGVVVRHGAEGRLVTRAADLDDLEALAIEADVDEVLHIEAPDHVRRREVRPLKRELHAVLAVQREVVPDRRAAARAERQLLVHAVVLPHRAVRDVIDGRARHDGRVAHGQTADLVGCEQVPLEEPRRHGQHVGDVVEPVAGVIGRQHRLAVDFEAEQVADRVGVLEAVQPMDRRAARVGLRAGGLVEGLLERLDEGAVRGRVGPLAAGGRHGARVHLGRDLLPDLGIRADGGQVAVLEHETGCLQPLAVARHAVGVDEALERNRRRGRGGACSRSALARTSRRGRGRQQADRQRGQPADEADSGYQMAWCDTNPHLPLLTETGRRLYAGHGDSGIP